MTVEVADIEGLGLNKDKRSFNKSDQWAAKAQSEAVSHVKSSGNIVIL